ncbi:hypothetical protein D7S86_23740 [Pararobbsia silviterrae]|uniref:Uncharacterized protein n=2 Tax=Pararobbsia silviterrae TaxID=1792498 RepID=A0A494XGD9_9BURK|nr:hypothetical protein D7S86_23740 [Pararobbsia silviterrae]
MNDKVGSRAVVGYGYESTGGGAACFSSSEKPTKQAAIDTAVAACRNAGAQFCIVAWTADSTPERDQALRQAEAEKKAAEQRKAQADLLKAQQEQAARLKAIAKTAKIPGPSIEVTSGFIDRKLQENKDATIVMTQHWIGENNPSDSSTSLSPNVLADYVPSVPCTIGGHDLRDLSKIQIDSYANLEQTIKSLGGSGVVTSNVGDSVDQISYAPNYSTLFLQFRKNSPRYDTLIKTNKVSADVLRIWQVDAKLLLVSVINSDDANRLASAITHAAELCGAGAEDADSPF